MHAQQTTLTFDRCAKHFNVRIVGYMPRLSSRCILPFGVLRSTHLDVALCLRVGGQRDGKSARRTVHQTDAAHVAHTIISHQSLAM